MTTCQGVCRLDVEYIDLTVETSPFHSKSLPRAVNVNALQQFRMMPSWGLEIANAL